MDEAIFRWKPSVMPLFFVKRHMQANVSAHTKGDHGYVPRYAGETATTSGITLALLSQLGAIFDYFQGFVAREAA